jgi:quinol-cytochrome oxidoreductase complex cytochrome b subunit
MPALITAGEDELEAPSGLLLINTPLREEALHLLVFLFLLLGFGDGWQYQRLILEDRLGGAEIGTDTLLRWYVLHVLFFPFITVIFMAIHFWRVRKDGGISGPL